MNRLLSRLAGCLPAVLLVVSLACGGSSSTAPDPRCGDCNVLLVSVDTLRADHLSLYGYERPTSPNLERLAEQSVVFDKAFNNGGGTLPVHMSMFTSLRPLVHNVHPKNNRILEPERVTLAEQLKERGYRTAGFADNGWVKGRFGFSQGFDLFDDQGGRLRKMLPKVLAWLDENHDAPFFLFLHTYDVHSEWKQHPYDCPGDYPDRYYPDYAGDFDGCWQGECASYAMVSLNKRLKEDPTFDVREVLSEDDVEYIRARYDGCINYVDDTLQTLWDRLGDLGVFDRTMIIVTSDHGEEFLDHGLMLHMNVPYEEMIHVPLVVKFPRSVYGGRRVSRLATTIDVMPTVLDVLGIPPNGDVEGLSLLPMLERDVALRRDTHIYSAIRSERWKFIMRGSDRYLFDLQADPDERQNLAEEHPELVERFAAEARRRMQADREQFARFQAARDGIELSRDLTPEEIEQLKALGYLN